jgi:hypothetical protein
MNGLEYLWNFLSSELIVFVNKSARQKDFYAFSARYAKMGGPYRFLNTGLKYELRICSITH